MRCIPRHVTTCRPRGITRRHRHRVTTPRNRIAAHPFTRVGTNHRAASTQRPGAGMIVTNGMTEMIGGVTNIEITTVGTTGVVTMAIAATETVNRNQQYA